MKKLMKKVLIFLLCIAMAQTPALSDIFGSAGVTALAATKNGLVKKNGKYYYYKDGKKLKNTWKTVTTTSSSGKKTKNKYYFGANGAAIMATSVMDSTYTIKTKTINGKKYGFDTKARMVTGLYVNETNSKFYYFNAKGVYNAKKTQKLRKASKRGSDLAALVKLLGEPNKRTESNSCITVEETGDVYIYITLQYDTFTVTGLRAPDSEEETVYALFAN
ncbi:MAG: hypothetical protein LIO94_08455 [Clostridiales bacterium]|nr:hypothetical protein [Clostridiales bacterium]